jgi:hypothetical protein
MKTKQINYFLRLVSQTTNLLSQNADKTTLSFTTTTDTDSNALTISFNLHQNAEQLAKAEYNNSYNGFTCIKTGLQLNQYQIQITLRNTNGFELEKFNTLDYTTCVIISLLKSQKQDYSQKDYKKPLIELREYIYMTDYDLKMERPTLDQDQKTLTSFINALIEHERNATAE